MSRMAVSKLKVVSDPRNYIATVEVGWSRRGRANHGVFRDFLFLLYVNLCKSIYTV